MRPILTWAMMMVGTILPAVGCGLSDYEKRMDDQEVALKKFDDENKTLGEPLDMPLLVDKGAARKVLPVEFYLRPPKGTAKNASNPEFPLPGKIPLVNYPGPPGFHVLVSASHIAKEEKGQKIKEGWFLPKDFQNQVRAALADFYARENKGRHIDWSGAKKTDKKAIPVQSGKGQTIHIFEFQTLTDDPSPGKKNPSTAPDKIKGESAKYLDFRLYFYQTGNDQAAVIYQIPSSKREDLEVNKGVDYSFRTLSLAQEAVAKRVEFGKFKR